MLLKSKRLFSFAKRDMKIKFDVIFCLGIFIIGCVANSPLTAQKSLVARKVTPEVKTQTLNLFDKSRNRSIPVELYLPEKAANKLRNRKSKFKLAILSHGYGGKNTDYSFIAADLVERGYVVASIQHELTSDEPMPTTGNIYETRKPYWERGAQNILFVIEELKKSEWNLDYKNLLLVGHSNGGDTSMLFASEHPDLVDKVISLDNRRMPIPRQKRPQILSIRSSEQTADAGVLPTIEEQKKLRIKIVKVNVAHNDMRDSATDSQKQEMIKIINDFL